MRTAITLDEFIFTLNQNEDIFVTVIDYERDQILYRGWKSDIKRHFENHDVYGNWFVQDFIGTTSGMDLTIVELKEELD